MEIKLTSIDFSRRIADDFRSSWLQNPRKLLIVPHMLGILTTNVTYCIILVEYIGKA